MRVTLNEKLFWFALIILSLGVMGAFGVSDLLAPGRAYKAWRDFAARIGTLRVEGGNRWPRLAGDYRGRSVQAWIAPRVRRTLDYPTLVSASCSRRLPDFALAPEGVWSEVEKAFGAQDIQIGDPAFDHAFLVAGTGEAEIRAFLSNSALRQTLLEQARTKLKVRVSGGQASLEKLRLVTDHTELESMFAAVTLVAQALDTAATTPGAR